MDLSDIGVACGVCARVVVQTNAIIVFGLIILNAFY
jgi:hypothetical protein